MDDKPPRPAPLSLRLTPDERQRLEVDAMGWSLGSYIKWRVFDPANPPKRRRGQTPVKDHQALAAVAAKLGQSRIASNLNQLAKAAHSGSLAIHPDVEAELREAVEHVAELRRMLIQALGLSDGGS